jgi:hypothetical protein
MVYLGCTNLHFGTESKMSCVKKSTCDLRNKKRTTEEEGERIRRRRRKKKEPKKTAESIKQRRIANKQVRAWSAW